jgi:hypothetical protein
MVGAINVPVHDGLPLIKTAAASSHLPAGASVPPTTSVVLGEVGAGGLVPAVSATAIEGPKTSAAAAASVRIRGWSHGGPARGRDGLGNSSQKTKPTQQLHAVRNPIKSGRWRIGSRLYLRW